MTQPHDTCMDGISRRQFGKMVGVGSLLFALSGSIFTIGCSVIDDLVNWAPVGLAAFNSVITILESAGVVLTASVVTVIRAAFAQLIADAKAYQAIVPPPAGLLAQIRTGLVIIVTNFQALLATLAISGGLVGLIFGLAQVILSTIASFEGRLPPAASGAKLVSAPLRVGNLTETITPVDRSRRKFISDFNTLCASGGHPEARLPVSLLERL